MFPETLEWPLERWVNQFLDWLVIGYGDQFEAFSSIILHFLIRIEWLLREIPWWALIIVIAGIAWHASRRWQLSTDCRSRDQRRHPAKRLSQD